MIEIFDQKYLKVKKIIVLTFASFFAVAIIFSCYLFCFTPKAAATSPEISAEDAGLKNNIEVSFNRPVNRDNINMKITPDILGQWRFEEGLLKNHLYTKLIFYPEEFFVPETQYNVVITGISGLLNKNKEQFSYSFKTQSISKIISSSISEGAKDVPINTPVVFNLSGENNGEVDFDFLVEPKTEFEKNLTEDKKSYELKFNSPLSQATAYKITAMRNILVSENSQIKSEPEKNFEVNFATKGEPGILSYSPNGQNVLTDTNKIEIKFSDEMNQENLLKNITISPIILGNWKWSDKTTLAYNISERLKYETSYSIFIRKGITGTAGSFLEKDINLTFRTIGHVKVLSLSPKNGAASVSTNSFLKITFDQPVDKTSAENLFFLEPLISGRFSWQDNTLVYSQDGLAKNTSYKFGVRAGIKSIAGLDSSQEFFANFSTEQSQTLLDVPQDYQDHSLSCEAASLKMALNYKGAGTSEEAIMNIVGYDPTIRNGNIWGDPYSAFVGDINGRQDTTGYGVYWDPIARAANNWRRAEAFTGWGISNLTASISAGNPVVVWGVTGRSIARDDWQTPDGKNILAWHGEHARVAIGYKGPADNPSEIILNDPISGRITWSKDRFLSDWSSFGNAGVVIY